MAKQGSANVNDSVAASEAAVGRKERPPGATARGWRGGVGGGEAAVALGPGPWAQGPLGPWAQFVAVPDVYMYIFCNYILHIIYYIVYILS